MTKKLKILILSLMLSTMTVSTASAVAVTVGASCTQSFTNAKFYLGGSSRVPTRTSITGTDNGYISVGDLCTIKDTSNNTYWKVEYPTSKGTKLAYAKKTDLFPNIANMKRINVAANTTVYTNSSMSTKFGTVFATDTVTLLSPISNGKAQIIYNVSGGYKIGWIYAEQSSTQAPTKPDINTALVGQVLANLNSIGYSTASGAPNEGGIKGQCVWYVRGRAYEKGYTTYNIRGNANQWFGNAKAKGVSTSSDINAIRSNSILCRNNGTYGHVVYIEHVDNSSPEKYIYYTEANVGGKDGALKKLPFSEFKTKVAKQGAGFQGYIYLNRR